MWHVIGELERFYKLALASNTFFLPIPCQASVKDNILLCVLGPWFSVECEFSVTMADGNTVHFPLSRLAVLSVTTVPTTLWTLYTSSHVLLKNHSKVSLQGLEWWWASEIVEIEIVGCKVEIHFLSNLRKCSKLWRPMNSRVRISRASLEEWKAWQPCCSHSLGIICRPGHEAMYQSDQ